MPREQQQPIILAGGGGPPDPLPYPHISIEHLIQQQELIIATPLTPPEKDIPWIEIGAGIIVPLIVAVFGIYIAKKK
jgi:hypothetical protein